MTTDSTALDSTALHVSPAEAATMREATRLAAYAAVAAGSPDPLIPGTPVLWEPRTVHATRTSMRLRVGVQTMTTWHVSDMATGRRVLALRSRPNPEGLPVLTTAFEPRPLRALRRHGGLVGAILDRNPLAGGPWMLEGEPHAEARAIIGRPFAPSAFDPESVRAVAEVVLRDHLAENTAVLDVSRYASDVMFRLIGHYLGAPPKVAATWVPMFREWMHQYNRSTSLAAMAYQPWVYRQLAAWIRRPPGPTGILAELHDARARRAHLGHHRPATMADLVALADAAINAATDTPAVALTQAVWFAACAGRMPDGVEPARAVMAESLRYHPPFTRPIARLTAPAELVPGVAAQAGEWVEVHLPALNRDQFTDPHTFNPDRADLANARPYGAGMHICVGQYWGTEVGAVILPVLAPLNLRRIPRQAYTRQPGPLHRIEHLPLAVTGWPW